MGEIKPLTILEEGRNHDIGQSPDWMAQNICSSASRLRGWVFAVSEIAKDLPILRK